MGRGLTRSWSCGRLGCNGARRRVEFRIMLAPIGFEFLFAAALLLLGDLFLFGGQRGLQALDLSRGQWLSLPLIVLGLAVILMTIGKKAPSEN